MQILPVNLTELVATILALSIVLIPVAGLTLRFALKPTVEALARFLDTRGLGDTVGILERRIEFQERRIESLEDTVRTLSEAHEFDRQLLHGANREGAPDRLAGSQAPALPPDAS